jgi:hypothetical protein
MGDAIDKALHQLNATVCNLHDEESDTPGIATPRKTLESIQAAEEFAANKNGTSEDKFIV